MSAIELRPVTNIPERLRQLALDIQSGYIKCKSLTWATDHGQVGNLGIADDDIAVRGAAYNMVVAINKLSTAWSFE